MTLRLLTFVPIAAETGHQSHHHQCHQYCESFKCYQHFKVFQVKLSRKAAVHHQQHHHWRRPLFFKLRKYKERPIINIFVIIISKANDLESRLLSFGPIAAKNGHPENLQKTSTSSLSSSAFIINLQKTSSSSLSLDHHQHISIVIIGFGDHGSNLGN